MNVLVVGGEMDSRIRSCGFSAYLNFNAYVSSMDKEIQKLHLDPTKCTTFTI
jgi:hypothetical protein